MVGAVETVVGLKDTVEGTGDHNGVNTFVCGKK